MFSDSVNIRHSSSKIMRLTGCVLPCLLEHGMLFDGCYSAAGSHPLLLCLLECRMLVLCGHVAFLNYNLVVHRLLPNCLFVRVCE